MSGHPSHRLYDSACELLFAAQSLRRAAQRQGLEEAIAAVLGCLGATIEQLAESSDELGRQVVTSRRVQSHAATPASEALDALTKALVVAEQSCDAARIASVGLQPPAGRLAGSAGTR